MLRLTRTPKSAAEAQRNCGKSLADPNVPTLIAQDVLEFIVSNHVDHVAFPEGKLQVQLWHEGRDIGRQEGRQEGRRLALLEMAARLVPDHVAALEAIEDVDALRARLVALTGGT